MKNRDVVIKDEQAKQEEIFQLSALRKVFWVVKNKNDREKGLTEEKLIICVNDWIFVLLHCAVKAFVLQHSVFLQNQNTFNL